MTLPEDTPGGFHEPDEPTDHIQAAFDAGTHGRTAPPRGQTRRLDVATGLVDEAGGQRVEVRRLLAGAAMVLDELNGTDEMLLKTRTERDRLAAQVVRYQRVVEQVRGLADEHAGCGDECSLGPELDRLLDALPDAPLGPPSTGTPAPKATAKDTDQTEDDHG